MQGTTGPVESKLMHTIATRIFLPTPAEYLCPYAKNSGSINAKNGAVASGAKKAFFFFVSLAQDGRLKTVGKTGIRDPASDWDFFHRFVYVPA